MKPIPIEILPFRQPPTSPQPPQCELPPRPQNLLCPHPEFTISRHIFPAAFPRTRVGGARPTSEPRTSYPVGFMPKSKGESLTKEWIHRNEEAVEVIFENGVYKPTLALDTSLLWMVVNRYSSNRKGGETLILAHANGMHKETWEPMLKRLLSSKAGKLIDEIWAIDHFNQGDSALLNAGNLGLVCDWIECGRDLANFILHYLPEKHLPAPYILPYINTSIIPNFSTNPVANLGTDIVQIWRSHRVHLVGHSLGAVSSTLACSILPSIIHSLTLLDGVQGPMDKGYVAQETLDAFNKVSFHATKGALNRIDTFMTRTDALNHFRQSKGFLSFWDQEVMKNYVQFGLYEHEEGITLKCHKFFEASTLADPNKRFATSIYTRLPMLSPNLKLHHVYATSRSLLPVWMRKDLDEAASQVKQTKTFILDRGDGEGPGHLMVQEEPEVVARLLGDIIMDVSLVPMAKYSRL